MRSSAVVTTPSPRMIRSLLLGTNSTTIAPRIGRNTVTVMAHCCQVVSFISIPSPEDEERQRDHAGEQADRVPLHLAALDRAQALAEGLHRRACAVHDEVDHVAVEPHDHDG